MPSGTSPVSTNRPVANPTTQAQRPPRKNEKYTLSDVALTFCKEKAKDIAKIGSYTAFWATEAMPNLPRQVTKFNHTLRDFKNFVSVTEIPEKTHNLFKAVKDFISATTDKAGKAARQVFKDAMTFINTIGDTIDFAHIFAPIRKEVMRVISGVNFAATAAGSGNGVAEQIEKLKVTPATDTKRRNLYGINLARDISYFALGIIGLTFVVTGATFIPWMIVACLTSGLSWTIGGYFYERLADPENKGKNLNPAHVMTNIENRYRPRTIA
jgi:hypothetical protein